MNDSPGRRGNDVRISLDGAEAPGPRFSARGTRFFFYIFGPRETESTARNHGPDAISRDSFAPGVFFLLVLFPPAEISVFLCVKSRRIFKHFSSDIQIGGRGRLKNACRWRTWRLKFAWRFLRSECVRDPYRGAPNV